MSNIISYQQQADGSIDITVPPEHAAEFRELVRRGANSWEGRSLDMRLFTDSVSGLDKIMGMKVVIDHTLKPKEFKLVMNTFGHPSECDCDYCILSRKPIVTPLCDGHPETCNCPKHCR